MSQNKTIVPGVDYDNLGKTEYNNEAFNDFYSRSGNDDNRTYIPGVAAKQPQAEVSAGAVGAVPTPIGMTNEADSRHFALQNRVVVGVLFLYHTDCLARCFLCISDATLLDIPRIVMCDFLRIQYRLNMPLYI